MNGIKPKEGWGTLEAAEKEALPHQFIMAVSTVDVPPGRIYYNTVKRTLRKHRWGTEPSLEEMERHNAQYESPPIYFIVDDEVEFALNAAYYVSAIRGVEANSIKYWTARKQIAKRAT
jgi:hypothetical protein